jgi:5-bromo-4-chloroindolyl phosphate hydrolysis protein
MPESIKNFFKKSGIYIALALAIILGISLFKKKVDEYETIVQKMQESHQKELDEIEAARKEERKKHEENERAYKERMATIEKEYDEAKKALDEKKKKDVDGIVKKYYGKPDQMAERFAKVTGFKIILPEED